MPFKAISCLSQPYNFSLKLMYRSVGLAGKQQMQVEKINWNVQISSITTTTSLTV